MTASGTLLPGAIRSFGAAYWEWLFVAGATLAAAILRLVALTDVPPGLHGDEAWTAMEAMRILEEGWIGPWSDSALGQPAGPFYWTAMWFIVLPETHFTVRFTTALLGIIAIPVFYLFAREAVGIRPAVIGTATLVFSYWHIHFSRTAFPLAAVPVVTAAALYFLVRGVRTGRMHYFALSGAFLGLGLYTYGSFPFLYVALSASAPLAVWQGRAVRQRLAGTSAGLAIFVAAALLVAAPFLWFAVQDRDTITDGSAMAFIWEMDAFENLSGPQQAGMLFTRAVQGAVVYHTGIQRDSTDALGGGPGLLDPIVAIAFTIGIVVALVRRADWRYPMLLFVLLAGILPAVLITAEYLPAAPVFAEYRRNIIAVPAVFALVGLGGDAVVRGLSTWLERKPRRWPRLLGEQRDGVYPAALAVIGVLFAASAVLNVQYYYFSWQRAEFTRWVFVHRLVEAIDYLRDTAEAEPVHVYFYSGRWSYNYETRRFLAPDISGVNRSAEFGEFSLDWDQADGSVVYLFLPPYMHHASDVMDRYPGGEYKIRQDEMGTVLFTAYHLRSAGASEASQQ